jgi:hypothetical protein
MPRLDEAVWVEAVDPADVGGLRFSASDKLLDLTFPLLLLGDLKVLVDDSDEHLEYDD